MLMPICISWANGIYVGGEHRTSCMSNWWTYEEGDERQRREHQSGNDGVVDRLQRFANDEDGEVHFVERIRLDPVRVLDGLDRLSDGEQFPFVVGRVLRYLRLVFPEAVVNQRARVTP